MLESKHINGIHFTYREIDIISCLLHGRSMKKTSDILFISSKTVETHIRNIMLKLECNSREKIIDFIEASDYFPHINDHYLELLIKHNFHHTLENLKKTQKFNNKDVEIISSKLKCKVNQNFVKIIKSNLKNVGVNIQSACWDDINDDINDNIKDNIKDDINDDINDDIKTNDSTFRIYLISEEDISQAQTDYLCCNTNNTYSELLLFINIPKEHYIPSSLSLFNHINTNNQTFLEKDFFYFLSKIYSDNETKEMINDFNIQCKTIKSHKILHNNEITKQNEEQISKQNSKQNEEKDEEQDEEQDEERNKEKKGDNKPNIINKNNNKNNLNLSRFSKLISSKNILIIIAALVVFSFALKNYTVLNFKQNKKTYIRSNLLLPNKNIFLSRTNILDQIDIIFKKNKSPIKTVILLGMGGSGKKTIARHYAQKQNNRLIWEINTQNQESFMYSLEKLAYVISHISKEYNNKLKQVTHIDNMEERKVKLLIYIKSYLKANPNWILIYKDINNFNKMSSYIPFDSKTWGKGKVIITTQNQNIYDSKYYNQSSVLKVNHLSNKEQKELFLNIIASNNKIYKLTPKQDIELDKFLKKIPPFPLDIAMAAYYLKNTSEKYSSYLKSMETNDKSFRDVCINIMGVDNQENQTRYTIVIESIKKIIQKKPNAQNLLYTIGLLESTKIPVNLLYKGDGKHSTLMILRSLSKYSLIFHKFSTPTKHISLHDNIHKILYNYTNNTISAKTKNKNINNLQSLLVKNIQEAFNNENITKLKLLQTHAQRVLHIIKSNNKSINTTVNTTVNTTTNTRLNARLNTRLNARVNTTNLKHQLGRIYLYLGQYEKGKNILESIKEKEQTSNILVNLGKIYKDLGSYKKSINLMEKALSFAKKEHGENSLPVAYIQISLETPYRRIGEYHKVKNFLEHSLKIFENQKQPMPHDISRVLTKLGNIHRSLGNYDKSKKLFEDSLKIQKKLYGNDSVRIAWTCVRSANVFISSNQFEKARDLLENSYHIYKKHFGENHIKVGWVSCYLGHTYSKLKNYDKAKFHLLKSLRIFRNHYDDTNVRAAWVFYHVGCFYNNFKEYDNAKKHLEKAVEIYNTNPLVDPNTAQLATNELKSLNNNLVR